MQFHPTALAVRRRAGRLPRHRGRARRRRAARDATTASASWTSWRPGTRSRARSTRACVRAGRRAFLDMRAVDTRALPQHRRAARRAPASIRAATRPGRARRALHDRRCRDRRARPLHAARPVRGRRVRVHGRARREPAGLELALGVLRLRPARGAVRRRRAGAAAGRPAARRRPAGPAAPRRRARRCGATPGPCATPAGLARLAADPYPLARADRALSALERRESRGCHLRDRPPGRRPRAGRSAHWSSSAAERREAGNDHGLTPALEPRLTTAS